MECPGHTAKCVGKSSECGSDSGEGVGGGTVGTGAGLGRGVGTGMGGGRTRQCVGHAAERTPIQNISTKSTHPES